MLLALASAVAASFNTNPIPLKLGCCVNSKYKQNTMICFNPQWDCTFNFTIHAPGLALVRFLVEDHDYTSSNDFLGQYTLPFTSLRTGYRHVRLLKQDGSSLSPSSLFIHVEIIDCQDSHSKSSKSQG
uniref:Phospholipase C, delta 3b n=1 Tax=Hippocampus comes TaxID=109280 RepID=A0A3Q3E592_HIPCM